MEQKKTIAISPIENEMNEKLLRLFQQKFITGYARYNNTILNDDYTKFADPILNFDIRNDDIWICSFPKSGTTWVQEMVWCIVNNMDLNGAKEFIEKRYAYLESPGLIGEKSNLKLTLTFDEMKDLPSPRFFKTHLPPNLLPLKLQNGATNAKLVYIKRNVRDTCVSFYHFCRLVESYKGDFDTFCDLFMNNYVLYSPYWEHVAEFSSFAADNENVLLLSFEDMKKDLKSVIRKVSIFLDKELSEEQIEILHHHLSFESMKNNEAVSYKKLIDIKKMEHNIPNGSFYRNGTVGQWKDEMSASMIEKFQKWENDNIENLKAPSLLSNE